MNEWQNNVQQQENEREIDVARLLQILLKRAWLIIAVAFVCCIATYLYSANLIAPTYRSDFTAYVDNRVAASTEGNGSTTTSDLNASIYLTYLYEDIIVSRSVLNDAADSCGLNYSYNQLKNMVSTSIAEDAALITVYVVSKDPLESMKLATAIADVAPGHVARMKEGSSMRILDEPILPDGQYAPHNAKNALLGAVIGFAISVVFVLVLDLTNDKVRNADELELRYNIVAIGVIPDLAASDGSENHYSYGRYGKAGKAKK